MLPSKVPLLRSSYFLCTCLPRVLFVPLALSPPWALQECRAYGTHASTPQPIQQQAQTTTPNNKSDNKRKQPHQTIIRMINRKLDQSARSPARAILPQSPGRKPWVSHSYTFIEPCKGGTFPTNAKPQTATTQNKCSHRKCRSYGAQFAFICVYPGLHFGLCPHSTLGFAGVSCLKALTPALPNPTTNANNETRPIIRTANDR